MQSHDAMQAARLALLEGAVLFLLRAAQEDDLDGLSIEVSMNAGQVSIDFSHTFNGMPVPSQSL